MQNLTEVKRKNGYHGNFLHTIIKIKKTLTTEEAQLAWARRLIIMHNPNKEQKGKDRHTHRDALKTLNIHRTGVHREEGRGQAVSAT